MNALRAGLLLVSATAAPAWGEDQQAIGWATMTDERVIILEMVQTSDGTSAHAQLRYAPGDPQYDEVLEHLGGLAPGESKPVMPFD